MEEMMETITAKAAGQKYGRHPVFFLAAARLSLLVPKKLRPMTFELAEVEAFFQSLEPATILRVSRYLKTLKADRDKPATS